MSMDVSCTFTFVQRVQLKLLQQLNGFPIEE